MNLRERLLEKFINIYPPLLGAGIRSRSIDEHTVDVEMNLTVFNRNVVGVHFGGSLYAMCDPWFMLILMRLLGSNYLVWDKAASIKFKKPGRGRVKARFHIPQEEVDQIRMDADREGKIEPTFSVNVLSEDGEIIAQVEKLLYVRRKPAASSKGEA